MKHKYNKFAPWQPRFEVIEPHGRFRYELWWARWKNCNPKTRKLKFVKPFGGVRITKYAPKWHMFWHRLERIQDSV